jgi:serine/threonine protein phosphatase PrpC
VGRRRNVNEDAFSRDDILGLYLVADGVGGHAKGEVASSEAVQHIHDFMIRNRHVLLPISQQRARRDEIRRLLEGAVQSACYVVHGMAEMDPQQRGMSTTLSALLVCDTFAVTAQVGDSRIYRVRGGKATQITEDHTLLNYQVKKGEISADQARYMRGKNVITRAIGHKDYVEVDTLFLDLHAGDKYLLCSDGLYAYLHKGELESVLVEDAIDKAPERFIELANMRGGKDNITIVLVCID